ERRYAIDTVLSTILGLEYGSAPNLGTATLVTVEGAGDGRSLTVADDLFATPEEAWLSTASLPGAPLPRWRVGDDLPEALTASEDLPVLFGHEQDGAWLRP